MNTSYHAKYFASELLRRSASNSTDKLSMSLFDASVEDDGLWKQKMTKAEFEDCHVLFQEDGVGYIRKMLGRVV